MTDVSIGLIPYQTSLLNSIFSSSPCKFCFDKFHPYCSSGQRYNINKVSDRIFYLYCKLVSISFYIKVVLFSKWNLNCHSQLRVLSCEDKCLSTVKYLRWILISKYQFTIRL